MLLYNLLIGPLELIMEFFFKLVQVITGNIGIAVLSLSIIVTFLTLPLYMVAENWQEKERCIQNKLKPGIDRIKQTFKGDEQYMILNTFYRENHYHPIMALRSSFSLLIQIPFFIAAYNFLSNLNILNGYSFMFIRDFGSPDATFHIKNFAINILPISMTIINCIAGYIYSKGHGIKEQIQIYICALVFLLLLYNSPAGLVIYWTMNNILSLVKNIFYKLKNPKKVIHIICCILAVCVFISILTFLRKIDMLYKCAFILFSILLVTYPSLIKYISLFSTHSLNILDSKSKNRTILFTLSCIVLAILAGLVIPSILIESQPDLYCYVDDYTSPFNFVIITFAKALGFFFVWPICFYFLFSNKTKNIFTFLFTILSVYSIINTFCFSGKYGSIEPTLLFMEPQSFFPSLFSLFINILIFVLIISLTILLLHKMFFILPSVLSILLISLCTISTLNLFSINKTFSKMEAPTTSSTLKPVYHLSKTGKNVILIMQDACLTPLLPEVFNEIPDLKNHFDGFTYFPNTTSLGSVTMTGSPGLFGGYDFTPYEINKRKDQTLQQKHNEALLTLPVLFHNHGYDVTVSNLPYENYLEEPVTEMYKNYSYINRVNTRGNFSRIWYEKHNLTKNPYKSFLIKRNFICFSIFKMVPPFLRNIIYSHKYWIANNPYYETSEYVNSFSCLEFLPQIIDTTAQRDSLIIIDDESTHADEFVESDLIPSNGSSIYKDDPIFKIHESVFLKYATLFDFLRKNDLYDNTRIIIVSDHGRGLSNHSLPELFHPKLNATLLVKDFNSNEPFAIDNTFMTNADTPYLMTEGIIPNAINPFTNNPLKVDNKNEYIKIAVPNSESTRIRHNYKFNINSDNWYTVKDNIYKIENWSHYYDISN